MKFKMIINIKIHVVEFSCLNDQSSGMRDDITIFSGPKGVEKGFLSCVA